MSPHFHPQPKPEKRATTKGRNDRIEAKVVQVVRAIVAERDGDCRLQGVPWFGVCGGESEWAHLEEKRRARTRKMDPAIRHTTQDSVMFCTTHHRRYDAYEFSVVYATSDGADGPLSFWDGRGHWTEPLRETR